MNKIIIMSTIIGILIIAGCSTDMGLSEGELQKCLEPLGRPVDTGLKQIDDCYHGCCLEQGEGRTECFDVCYSID